MLNDNIVKKQYCQAKSAIKNKRYWGLPISPKICYNHMKEGKLKHKNKCWQAPKTKRITLKKPRKH
jgi:hypothetical protein